MVRDVLVQSSDHGVGGGTTGSNTPGGGIGDEDSSGTGKGDRSEQERPPRLRATRISVGHSRRGHNHSQVPVEVLHAPVFDQDRQNDEHGDRKEIIIKHRIPVFEPSDLDPLPHIQNLSSVINRGFQLT